MLKAHEYAEVFPMMAEDALAELAADIKANGLRDKIVTLNGLILDGRNRYAACQIAGYDVGPSDISEYRGKEPIDFVISCNLNRRHLTTSQRSIAAARLSQLKIGSNQHEKEGVGIPQRSAAEIMKVSRDSVIEAKKVLSNGTPEQVKDVEAGKKTVHAAVKEIESKSEPEADADPLGTAAAEFCSNINGHTRTLDTWSREFDELKSDPLGHNVHWQTVLSQLVAVRKALHQGRPRRKCPYCKATGKKGREKCTACKGCGYVCQSIYVAGCKAVGEPSEADDE